MKIRQLVLIFFFILGAFAVSELLLFIKLRDASDTKAGWVSRSHQVKYLSQTLLNGFLNAETGQRGYILTQNESYLEPYFDGIKTTEEALLKLLELVSDNPDQLKKLADIRTEKDFKFNLMLETIQLIKNNDPTQALTLVKQNMGKASMDKIRAYLDAFLSEENKLLAEREKDYQEWLLVTSIVQNSLVFLLACMATVGYFILVRKVLNPLKNLENASKNFSIHGGNSFTNVKTTNNEIGVLHQAILEMLQNIEAIQQKLESSVITAERANHAKSAFLATMSHEIRTPLNAIIGSAYLLSLGTLTLEQRQDLEAIEASSKNLLALINDVLDFSKIEAGEITFDPHPFSLEEVFHELRAMFSSTAATKGLNFEIAELPDGIPLALLGDDNRLRQMLINLLGNALKFTTKGNVKLLVKIVETNEQNKQLRLRFSVSDTGIGIPDKTLHNLFVPFSQADQSTTRVYGGTGLGLSIVKRLAELMGGSISVESILGQGSTFSLELPFGVTESIKHIRMESNITRQIHVLVAEDNLIEQRLLMQMCGNFGWNVEAVDNGRDMIEKVMTRLNQNHPFDCIVMDWHMPVMDGLAALAELKRMPDKRMPSVIMVTSQDIDRLTRAIADARPDSILVKPVEPSRLFNHVNEAVVAHSDNLGYLLSGTLIEPGHSHWLDGLRILAVDDSELNLKVVDRTLKNEGALTTICASGEAAVAVISQNDISFDIVLMDMQMPGMDGCECTRRIRADGRFKNLPIVALTAGATTTEKARAMESGMNGFLTKPINPSNLVRAIRRHVEESRGQPLPLVQPRVVFPTPKVSQSVPQQANDDPDGWPVIDGIDLARAKELLIGDPELFNEMLQMFAKENSQALAEICALINDGENAQAAKRAHKLGGQAGTVGAIELQQNARSLEQVLLSNSDDVNEKMSTFDLSLTRLLQSIDTNLAN